MENLSILFGIVFWPTVLVLWILLCRWRKLGKRVRVAGIVVLVGLPLLCALSLARWIFLSEPLSGAAEFFQKLEHGR